MTGNVIIQVDGAKSGIEVSADHPGTGGSILEDILAIFLEINRSNFRVVAIQ